MEHNSNSNNNPANYHIKRYGATNYKAEAATHHNDVLFIICTPKMGAMPPQSLLCWVYSFCEAASIHPAFHTHPPKNNLNGLTMTQKPNEYKAIPKQYTSVDDRVTSSYKKQNKTEQSRTQPSRTELRTQLCYRIESGRLYRLFICLKCQTLLSNSLPKAASNTNELCLNGDPREGVRRRRCSFRETQEDDKGVNETANSLINAK